MREHEMRRLDSVELMDYIKVYENGNISMSLLLTDNSSIINSIQEIHVLHVNLNINNSHVRRYTGGNSHG